MEPLEELQFAVSSAISHATSQQLAYHPEGKWSSGQILEHLYLSYTGTIKGFERILQAGKPQVTAPKFKQRVGALLVLRLRYMPSGREAPKAARPKGLPADQVLSEIVPRIGEMDALLSQCAQKLGRGKLLDHPILGPLTAEEWKTFHLVHGMHHVKQIRSLMRA